MASAELSRRLEKVVGYPPLSEVANANVFLPSAPTQDPCKSGPFLRCSHGVG